MSNPDSGPSATISVAVYGVVEAIPVTADTTTAQFIDLVKAQYMITAPSGWRLLYDDGSEVPDSVSVLAAVQAHTGLTEPLVLTLLPQAMH